MSWFTFENDFAMMNISPFGRSRNSPLLKSTLWLSRVDNLRRKHKSLFDSLSRLSSELEWARQSLLAEIYPPPPPKPTLEWFTDSAPTRWDKKSYPFCTKSISDHVGYEAERTWVFRKNREKVKNIIELKTIANETLQKHEDLLSNVTLSEFEKTYQGAEQLSIAEFAKKIAKNELNVILNAKAAIGEAKQALVDLLNSENIARLLRELEEENQELAAELLAAGRRHFAID